MLDLDKDEHEQKKAEEPASLAVCANHPESVDGLVIWCSGKVIEFEIEQMGRSLEDLGLNDAPEGLSVWEGTFRYVGTGPDIEAQAVGVFRAPTDEEWSCIMNGKAPWLPVTEVRTEPTEAEEDAAACICDVEDGPDCPVHNPPDLFPSSEST